MNTHTYVNASIYTQSMIYSAEWEVFSRYEPSAQTTSCVEIRLVTFVNVSAQPSPQAVTYASSKCLIKLKWFKNNDDKYVWIPALHGSAAQRGGLTIHWLQAADDLHDLERMSEKKKKKKRQAYPNHLNIFSNNNVSQCDNNVAS